MPTLLSVNNYYYYRGGAETVFLEQNKLLAAVGWKVVPFCMTHPRNMATPWSEYFVDEIEFGSQYSLVGKLSRVPKVVYSTEARRKLDKLLDATRPDICHAHNIYNHISPSILSLLKARGVPTVLTLHDLKIACPAYNMLSHDGICERCKGGRLYNVLVHRCVKGSAALSAVVMLEALVHGALGSYRRNVDRFVVPSQFYIDKLVEWGMPRAMFAHVPNFVDAGNVVPEYAPGKVILYFGRLSREKGLATLVRAAAIAGCKLWLAGTGPQLDELRQLAASLGVDAQFPGYLTGDALRSVVRQARAVAIPSEWYENAPMTVLEAYALGKPVIGARIGGIPELIKEGETGLIFESGSVEALAAALSQFVALPDAEISRMGRNARQWVEQSFTAEIYRSRILSIYGELGIPVEAQAAMAGSVPRGS
jgi:glycosyltransferase involved in cell wall biosynthesis